VEANVKYLNIRFVHDGSLNFSEIIIYNRWQISCQDSGADLESVYSKT
jgi:hypothetical protein